MEMSEDLITQVKELPIKEVIEDFANTVFNNRGFAPSPFRDDPSDSSFSISEVKNCFMDWKLRSSGYSGDPVRFVMLYKGWSWIQSVLALAGSYGVIPPDELKKYGNLNFKVSQIKNFKDLAPRKEALLAERANPSQIDRVYRELIKLSPLKGEDYQYLLDRGLTSTEIIENQFFSAPTRIIAKKLVRETDLTEEDLVGIPGFYKYNKDDKTSTFNASSGIGIPCRNEEGLIEGLQIRTTSNQSGLRYFWISSAKADGIAQKEKVFGYWGVGPGTPVDYNKGGKNLCITEGKFKSVALLREPDWDFSVASIQGVGNWRCKELDRLLNLYKTKSVCIAYDADAYQKEEVFRQLKSLAEYIGSICEKPATIMFWPEEVGKGIDDVLEANEKETVSFVPFPVWKSCFDKSKIEASLTEINFSEIFLKNIRENVI